MRILNVFALAFLLPGLLAVSANDDDNKKVMKLDPIVIRTPERNYEEPNLNDFKQCSMDLEKCKASCDENDSECLDKCPTCPILIAQDTVIQGVNDTDFKVPYSKPINSTNVIRVTNEIRNVIDNNLGDIIARNENNVQIYQKNSTTGGDYGLGYDETGPCCMVVARQRPRQRLCGSRCRSRVMYARPVVQCANEDDRGSCRQSMEYKPYRPKRQHHYSSGNSCSYQSEWPFVSCRSRRENRQICSPMCLELAYGYILQHGIPLHCVNCFKKFHKSASYIPPMGYSPENDFGINNEDDWTLEQSKCRLSDGTIAENCNNGMGADDDDSFSQPTQTHSFPNDQFDYESFPDDPYFGTNGQRHRRNTFRRSKYSLRHKPSA